MTNNISYEKVSRVLQTWELARQKYGTEEELGTKILLSLFRTTPATKAVFGFQPGRDIERNPMLRMGVLVHGTRMVEMLDGVLALLGPDSDLLDEVLSTLGRRHERLGVKKEYFPLLGDAICDAITEILGDRFAWEDDLAWKDVFDMMSTKIVNGMS